MSLTVLETGQPSPPDDEVESPYDTPDKGEVLPSLSSQLKDWALSTDVCASHLSSLLKILQPHHSELPSDARTLLRTVRTTDVKKMGLGSYVYFGLTAALLARLACGLIPNCCSTLSLIVNVDGIPLLRS